MDDVSPASHEGAWRPHEAQMLAALLRSARLTVLYGESGPSMTTLLRSGVLPLLRGDPDTGPGVVVIDLDDWSRPPLPALQSRLLDALPQTHEGPAAPLAEQLAALHERLGVRFLFVLDRFDEFLEAPPDREDLRDFSHAFVEAVNRPGLAANFLIALREEAKPALKRLRRRIPGLAQHGLRLSAREDGSLELLPVLEQDADLRSQGAAGQPRHVMKADEVYASIETLLSKTADGSREAPWQGPPGEPEGADEPVPPLRADSRPQPVEPAPDTTTPPPARPFVIGPSRTWRAYAIAAAVVLPVLLAAWMLGERAGRQAAVEPGAEPAPTRFVLLTDADAGTDARIAAELARQLRGDSGLSLAAASAPDGTPAWAALQGPQLAIMRADALQAASDGGGPSLRIVTPLFVEEVHVLVRADSPLTSMQQLKGKRINIGPPDGVRARTATRLYQAMFGARPPVSGAGALPLDAALRQLLDRKGIDAIIVIDGQPSAWLAAQGPDTVRALRLLPAAGQSAPRGWLPARVRGDSGAQDAPDATPTWALMSFLVTSAAYDDADPDAMGRLARALCEALPSLRRDGHPKWLELQPGWQEQAGWPYSPSAVRGFRACLR